MDEGPRPSPRAQVGDGKPIASFSNERHSDSNRFQGSRTELAGLVSGATSAAWADYEATAEPTRKDEPWRFSDIGALRFSDFPIAEPVTSEGRLINNSQGFAEFSAKLVFGNNTLLHQDVERLPEGVLLKSLDVAARENEELFRKFFMAQPVELGSHKYAALHKAR